MKNGTAQMSVYIVLNPNADKGGASRKRRQIEDAFTKHGIHYVIQETNGPLDAIGFARAAVEEGYRTIVAAGGDGTANEVVDGLIRGVRELSPDDSSAPRMGIIPVGRGNDFAFTAGIPTSIEEAVALIASGVSSPVDYGEVTGGRFPEGRCFLNGVGIGFEPMVNFYASDFKHVTGLASYVLALVKVIINYPRAARLDVLIDDSEQKVFETQQLSICNGRRMGAAFIMGPQAVIDDGYLDVVYANKPLSLTQILRLVLRFFKGTQLSTPHFSMIRVKKIVLKNKNSEILCHTDGEEVSRGCDRIEVQIYPGGVNFIRNV